MDERDRIHEKLMELTRNNQMEIAAIREKQIAADKRIDENKTQADKVHSLVVVVENLGETVKKQNGQMEKFVVQMEKLADAIKDQLSAQDERSEAARKSQGERIGAIEREMIQMSRNQEEIAVIKPKLDALILEPANKWKAMVAQITGLVIAAIAGGLLSNIF